MAVPVGTASALRLDIEQRAGSRGIVLADDGAPPSHSTESETTRTMVLVGTLGCVAGPVRGISQLFRFVDFKYSSTN